jgi:hypothetical protein
LWDSLFYVIHLGFIESEEIEKNSNWSSDLVEFSEQFKHKTYKKNPE